MIRAFERFSRNPIGENELQEPKLSMESSFFIGETNKQKVCVPNKKNLTKLN